MTLEPDRSREVQVRLSCAFCSAHILVGLVELKEGRFLCGVCERTSEANLCELHSFAADLCAVLTSLDGAGGWRPPMTWKSMQPDPRRNSRLLTLFMILAVPFMACASPGYMPRSQLAPASVDDSAVVTGPLRWVLHAGDGWLRVRVSNSGDSAVLLSWEGAQWITADGILHRLVEASRLREFVAMHRAAVVLEAMLPLSAAEEAMLFSRRQANALEHRAPAGLGSSEPGRVGKGETAEWVLYPAEHITVGTFGDVFVEPLFAAHAAAGDDPLRPLFALLVPIHIDGWWTTVSAAARAHHGIR